MNGSSEPWPTLNAALARPRPPNHPAAKHGPALAALAAFAETTLAPLQLLASLQSSRDDEARHELLRLASVLGELQTVVTPGAVVRGETLRRLFAALSSPAE